MKLLMHFGLSILSLLLAPIQEYRRQAWIRRLQATERELAKSYATRLHQIQVGGNPKTRAERLAYLKVCEVKLTDIVSAMAPGKTLENLTIAEAELVFYEMQLRDVGLTAGAEPGPAPDLGRPEEIPVPA